MKYHFPVIFPLFYLFYISVARKHPTKSQTVTLMFVGDINLDGPGRYFVERGLSTYNVSFEYVAKYLRKADYAIGNLESPFGTNEMSKNYVDLPKDVYLLVNPESVHALRFAGIDSVTLANNHINDFGEEPVELTLRTLKANGIDSFGINRGSPYASQVPLIKKIKGIKFGFLSYCDVIHDPGLSDDMALRKKFKVGMAIYKKEVVEQDIKKLKNQVDVMVVYMHWGKEWVLEPYNRTRKRAKFLRSLGVHLIIGAHPHVIQGHGYYGKSFLSYSIGHFIFGQRHTNFSIFQSPPGKFSKTNITTERVKFYEELATRSVSPTKDTLILKVQVTKDGSVSAAYLPCEIQFNIKKKNLQPVPRYENQWIDVCGEYDTLCLHNDKRKRTT